VASERERFGQLLNLLSGRDGRCATEAGDPWSGIRDADCYAGSAIVYVPTRNRADGVANALRWRGIAAAPYHAALPGGARRALLTRFLDGRIRVIVATNAFGMGIDKPDVRLVAHLGVPPRPEAYYQEAGRAGRDGNPADCVLFWMERDFQLAGLLAGRATVGARGPTPPHVAAAARALSTMRAYVTTRGCRRRVLLSYLGETCARCSGCDRCGKTRR
jgi:ATP-dependent DNA helicase RecQ